MHAGTSQAHVWRHAPVRTRLEHSLSPVHAAIAAAEIHSQRIAADGVYLVDTVVASAHVDELAPARTCVLIARNDVAGAVGSVVAPVDGALDFTSSRSRVRAVVRTAGGLT